MIAYVLPITHTPPLNDEDGIEIPGATKQHLHLDAERSWIITAELNQTHAFRRLPVRYLPQRLMRLVLDQVKKGARDKQLKTVPRTE
jgi:hypothetical protein